MKKLETQKGITLIALVITIIILIILAGISISMLVGENGLITKSKEAKQNTQLAEGQENKELANLTEYLNGELDGNGGASNLPDDTTKPELQSLKLLINTGEDGILKLGLSSEDYSTDTVIDWGDGTVQDYNAIIAKRENSKVQLASLVPIHQLKVAAGLPTIDHTYTQKNKQYTITITGTWKFLELGSKEKLLEVVQWGTTGLESISLGNSENLTKIAQPSRNSFTHITSFNYSFEDCPILGYIPENLFANCPNVIDFSGTFSFCSNLISIPKNLFANCPNVTSFSDTFSSCHAITTIPENLFANCPNVTSFSDTFSSCHAITTIPENLFANCPNVIDFSGTFSFCSNLTSIPKNLFANCLKVEAFNYTFSECSKLTGDPIALWERVPNGETNGYQGVPDGNSCYTDSTGLNNYNSIPEYWRYPFPS
ncbi:MAG: leucine-rich repeat domain-containing protein [Clostridia bacterium]